MTDSAEFEVFELTVLHAGGQFWLSAASRLGAVNAVPRAVGETAFALPTLADEAAWFADAIRRGAPEPEGGLRFGSTVRDVVFGVPEIESMFRRTRGSAAAARRPLLVRLLVAPEDVAALPWELMLDPDNAGTPLVFAADAHLVRVARDRRYPLRTDPVAPPLNVLLVLSNPQAAPDGTPALDEAPFDHYEEGRALLDELAGLQERGLLQVDVENRPTIENLRRRIGAQVRGYHVVHYLGHARPGALKLEDSTGRPVWVASSRFNDLLRSCPDLRLTVFAGCRTANLPPDRATPGPAGIASSIADQCVQEACQTVLGMQAVLPFRTEQVLTRFFYQALCSGATAARALSLARAAVRDDRTLGPGLLNWAVPSLVTGHQPVAIVDTAVPARPAPPAPRCVRLKLDLTENDREFFARFAQLKIALAVLNRQDPKRVLWVTGPPGSGKSRLLARALDELDASVVAVLYVTARRLVRDGEPVLALCRLVEELLTRAGRFSPARDALWSADEWWDRLVEELVATPFVLALDDVDQVEPTRVRPLGGAVDRLVSRVSMARVAIAGDDSGLGGLFRSRTQSLVSRVNVLHLEPREVLDWVRRNRPALALALDAQPKSELAAVHNQLGPSLELWSQLAEAWTERQVKDIPTAVAAVLAARRPPAATTVGPADGPAPADTHAGPLRLVVAGPGHAGRARLICDGIVAEADTHGVGARVVPADAPDASAAVAHLVTEPAPGGATDPATTTGSWPDRVRALRPDVVLLDRRPEGRAELVAAAGAAVLIVPPGLARDEVARLKPSGPVLGVGSLTAAGQPDKLSRSHRDPDLFVPGRGSVQWGAAGPPVHNAEHAALAALAALVLVWSLDRTMSGSQVVGLLRATSSPLPKVGPDARRLDLDAALGAARKRLLEHALDAGPLDVTSAAATTGLTVAVAQPLLVGLVRDKAAHQDEARYVRA